jgi:hypothetical protein
VKAGDQVVWQEFGHACAVTYKKRRHVGTVLAAGLTFAVIAWTDGTVSERLICQLGERP